MKHKTAWRWWAKSLGEKASKCDKESDTVAIIRTFIFVTYFVTNCFIVAGVIRHWNDGVTVIELHTEQPARIEPPVYYKGNQGNTNVSRLPVLH